MGWTILVMIVVVLLSAALYAILIYNLLVAKRQKTQEAWSGIDVQLKRRSDLVPNLVETVKGYLGHEKDLLERVTQLRTKAVTGDGGSVADRAATENQLGGALARLFAVAEAYPDLRASENFQDLHNSLDEIERDLQHARRYYNGAVRDLNIKVQSFPSNLVAKRYDFEEAAFFELDTPAERKVPEVSF